MSNHRQVGLCFLAACIALSLTGPWLRGEQEKKRSKPDYKVTIYDDEFLRGKNFVVRQDVADLDDPRFRFNDKSESLSWHLAPGRAAVLFDDKGFVRPVLILVGEGTVNDLGKQQPNALHSISSVGFVSYKKGSRPRGLSRDIPMVGTEP
jgi:hypothetical protein